MIDDHGAEEELPPILDLVQEYVAVLGRDPMKVVLASVGLGLVLVPVTLVALLIDLALIFGGMVPGIAAENEMYTDLGMLLGTLIGTVVVVVGLPIITGPLQASLMRALDGYFEDPEGSDLGIQSAFGTATTGMGPAILFSVVQGVAVMIGVMFCYLPGLVVAFATDFGLALVALKGRSPLEAAREAVAHAQAHTAWHLGYFGILLGVAMILSYIPVIGTLLSPGLLIGWRVFVFRRAMGHLPAA